MPLRILGSRVDAVSSRSALAEILGFLQSKGPHHVITGNTLMVLAAQEDPELHDILERAALVVPESWGIRWASRVHGRPLPQFTPGIEFMLEICRAAEAAGHSVFLLGSAPGIAQEAGEALTQRFPGLKIVGTCHGFFSSPHPGPTPSLSLRERVPDATTTLASASDSVAEGRVRQSLSEAEVIRLVRQRKPSILFVGMGMPAQEKWIARNLQALGVPVVMGVGGSFDVLSGRLKRAPLWVRRLGIEWSYRLIQEPWRWRRIAQLPIFAWRVWREKRQ